MKKYILSIMKDERKTPDGYAVAALLSIVSAVYSLALKCMDFFYETGILRAQKAPVKVISVGNITLGGTGKTPFTIALAENLKNTGKRPAVLTRGYGGDESVLLEERLTGIPVLIGADRIKKATEAKAKLGSDCVILDDGFQHRSIKRDLNIVLIDATCPFGNLKIFPRGILREPLARLKDADIAVLTKSDMGRENIAAIRRTLKGVNDRIDIAESVYQFSGIRKISSEEERPLTDVSGKKVALLAGIANPDYFTWMAAGLNCEIIDKFYYTDHHQYREKDLKVVVEKCLAQGVNLIITTEKDAVRLRRLKNIYQQIKIFVLRINFKVNSNEKSITDRLHSMFNS